MSTHILHNRYFLKTPSHILSAPPTPAKLSFQRSQFRANETRCRALQKKTFLSCIYIYPTISFSLRDGKREAGRRLLPYPTPRPHDYTEASHPRRRRLPSWPSHYARSLIKLGEMSKESATPPPCREDGQCGRRLLHRPRSVRAAGEYLRGNPTRAPACLRRAVAATAAAAPLQ